jgi:tRNA nucleotidyltransferase (CCA-adding enzyme)
MDDNDYSSIINSVLAEVRPSHEERSKLQAAVDFLVWRIREQAGLLDIDIVDVVPCGSAARDTWLPGSNDIDLFIQFREDVPEVVLKEQGLKLGQSIVPEWYVSYAEHPYVCATYNGFDLDFVPCYKLEPKNGKLVIKSAVDRTPFHNAYLRGRMQKMYDDFQIRMWDEVRLFKRFAKGIGVYGSEHKTNGMSGYLCELLTVNYGGFLPAVEAIANWDEMVTIDMEGHKDFSAMRLAGEVDVPLIVVDPVDGKRNVAAALSPQKYSELIDGCRRFLAAPSAEFFFPKKETSEPLTDAELFDIEAERGTNVFAVGYPRPADVHDDILYPQLRKVEGSITRALDKAGFRVFRSDVFVDERNFAFVFEMEVFELPGIKRIQGPPIKLRAACENYRRIYPNAFVDGDRLAAIVDRSSTYAGTFVLMGLYHNEFGKVPSPERAEGFFPVRDGGAEYGRFLRKFLRM